jgi:hypothetical protein
MINPGRTHARAVSAKSTAEMTPGMRQFLDLSRLLAEFQGALADLREVERAPAAAGPGRHRWAQARVRVLRHRAQRALAVPHTHPIWRNLS